MKNKKITKCFYHPYIGTIAEACPICAIERRIMALEKKLINVGWNTCYEYGFLNPKKPAESNVYTGSDPEKPKEEKEKWNENVELCSDCGIQWKKIGKSCPVCFAPPEKLKEEVKESNDLYKILSKYGVPSPNRDLTLKEIRQLAIEKVKEVETTFSTIHNSVKLYKESDIIKKLEEM